ncbi:MAG: hypothetical protein HYU65_05365 [Armatimonadetes bacterium]|nr:hypothetical protein [Armatimonadota bacterium]
MKQDAYNRTGRSRIPLAFLAISGMILLGFLVLQSQPAAVMQLAAVLPSSTFAGSFPLFVKIDYRKEAPLSVRGSALPGTVVQVRNDSDVVSRKGTYAMTTSLPLSLVAVRDGKIRRFRFDLPAKAKPYLSSLTVNADLSRMRSSVNGQLTITTHPAATIIVTHVEKASTHQAPITAGRFTISLPLVRGTNTLRWWVLLGIIRTPGPDITFDAQ